jgi:polar amino acid transport system substrate-binding protein
MSRPVRASCFSLPIRLALSGMVALAGLAVAATYPPVDHVPSKAPSAAATSRQALRIGVEALPRGELPGDTRLYTEEGLEFELGQRLASGLGRDLRFVQVALAQRARALGEGKIDVFVGRFDARPVPAGVDVILSGYRSGLSVAMRTDTSIRHWQDLAGRTVCASSNNLRARDAAIRHGALVKLNDVPAQSLMQVRTGDCDAAIHDANLLQPLLQDQKWQKFSASLPATEALPLAVAVARTDPALSAAVAQAMAASRQAASWQAPAKKWASNVAFEVYLEQESPDCH